MTRIERVSELIKKEISLILREKVSDPRIGFVSITSVDVSPDLKTAKVFFSVLGDEKAKKGTMEGLRSAKSFIRGELGDLIDMRYVPEIFFVYDKSLERGSRVLSLMYKIKNQENSENSQPKGVIKVKKTKRKESSK